MYWYFAGGAGTGAAGDLTAGEVGLVTTGAAILEADDEAAGVDDGGWKMIDFIKPKKELDAGKTEPTSSRMANGVVNQSAMRTFSSWRDESCRQAHLLPKKLIVDIDIKISVLVIANGIDWNKRWFVGHFSLGTDDFSKFPTIRIDHVLLNFVINGGENTWENFEKEEF